MQKFDFTSVWQTVSEVKISDNLQQYILFTENFINCIFFLKKLENKLNIFPERHDIINKAVNIVSCHK